MIEPVWQRHTWRTTRKCGGIVPVGQETDLASVPRLAWLFLGHPFQATVAEAAIAHDYRYRFRIDERAEADRLFYLDMIIFGTARWKAALFWYTVRCFGWYAWWVDSDDFGRGIDG